jgi:hypothetical protein
MGKQLHDVNIHKIMEFLGLPMTRLGQYGMELAPIYGDLDAHSRKILISSLKTIDSLFQKCSAKAMRGLFI